MKISRNYFWLAANTKVLIRLHLFLSQTRLGHIMEMAAEPPASPTENARIQEACKELSSCSVAGFLSCRERRPWSRLHISKNRLLPAIFRVFLEKICGEEVSAAGMASARHHAHLFCQAAVSGLPLHRATRIVGSPFPLFYSSIRRIDVAAQRAFIRIILLFVAIEVISQELFCHVDVDLSFILLHQFFPSHAAGVRRRRKIIFIELGSILGKYFRILGEVRTDEITVLCPPQWRTLQREF